MLYMIRIDKKDNLYQYNNAIVIDVTNRSSLFSPYYPHGGIPVPNTPNLYLSSVYGVWKELCVINHDSCESKRSNLLFQKGAFINEYWTHIEARREIFIPLYCWMLENKVYNAVEYLRKHALTKDIVIIDKTVNSNINNIDESLSSAFLLKSYIEGKDPYQNAIKEVIERKYVMMGRKEVTLVTKKFIPQKIACIYTGAQRILDLRYE